eukprot:jgi/Mesen1/8563/ME000049S07955
MRSGNPLLCTSVIKLKGRPGMPRILYSAPAPAGRSALYEESERVASALKKVNLRKNRYSDGERERESASEGPPGPGAGSKGRAAGAAALPSFIATQGPLESTTGDFWHMVVQERCSAVIMLTREKEGHRVKCGHYFPAEEGTSEDFGHMRVSTRRTALLAPAVVCRTLEIVDLQNAAQEEPFQVAHYQYLEWPDHGVPLSTQPIRHLIRHLRLPPPAGPFLVHCSAGIGRTGAYCTIDHSLRRLLSGDAGGLDIARTVRHFRMQRAGMDQYRFCYLAIRDELQEILGDLDGSSNGGSCDGVVPGGGDKRARGGDDNAVPGGVSRGGDAKLS